MSLLGLDIGSTGCKCTAFSQEGAIRAEHYVEYDKDVAQTDLPAEELWRGVKTVLGACAQAVKADPPEALAVSSFGESFVPVDANLRPLSPIIMYADDRSAGQLARIVEAFGAENVMRVSGAAPHPMYSLSKIAWTLENLPEVRAKVKKFLLVADYVCACLTGETKTDSSLACRTMAFDVTNRAWSEPLLSLAGARAEQMAEPIPTGGVAGALLPSVARETGLPENLPVVIAGHDQVAVATGAGALREGQAVNGAGTVECITPVFGAPKLDAAFLEQGYVCVPHAEKGCYVTYAFNFTGGSLVQWFRDKLAPALRDEAKSLGENVYARFERDMPEEPTSLLLAPHFSGAGTPHMTPGATGVLEGLTMATTLSDLYKAILEGVAYESKVNIDRLAAQGVPIRALRATGGGARSQKWLQIKADVWNLPIETLEGRETGAAGCAMLAGLAIGAYASLEDAARAFVRVSRTVEPNPRRHEIYREQQARYERLRAFSLREAARR